jgi:hypothetical protein
MALQRPFDGLAGLGEQCDMFDETFHSLKGWGMMRGSDD